jgi:hypothetical protein
MACSRRAGKAEAEITIGGRASLRQSEFNRRPSSRSANRVVTIGREPLVAVEPHALRWVAVLPCSLRHHRG